MITIDKERAIEELHKAVEAKGADHVADECVISRDGEPICIVGQVLYQIVGDEKFRAVKPKGIVGLPARSLGVELTEGAYSVLQAAQDYQDGRLSHIYGDTRQWGDAVEYAIAKVNG